MGDGEDYSGLMTSKIKDIATTACREEMGRCMLGHDNEKSIKNLEGEVEDLRTDIKTGFKEITDNMKADKEKKDNKIWDIVQIVVTMILTAVIAYKWH
jgi:hypothetical protein